MINLLLGAPGGGKSYEANVYHILPALQAGRKVITNLPLNVSEYAAIDPSFPALLELRRTPQPILGSWDPTRETGAYDVNANGKSSEPPKGSRAFGGVWDYYDTWKHPESGQGPLYVIDECHLPMPKGKTQLWVEEWYSLHRHFNADVLLITQSYGKLSQDVRDLTQMVYRVRKNVALGSTGSYTRKVQDGLRGEVVNTSIRKYESRYFKLYKSHTQGDAASEANASDVRPIWKNWTFIGAAICFAIVLAMIASGNMKAPWSSKEPATITKPTTQNASQTTAAPSQRPNAAMPRPERATSAPTSTLKAEQSAPEPYANRGIHLNGFMEMNGRTIWSFLISQNGQAVASITDAELIKAGYRWTGESQCSGVLNYGDKTRTVICDSPQVGPGIPNPRKGGDK